jgi:hypothetical protein
MRLGRPRHALARGRRDARARAGALGERMRARTHIAIPLAQGGLEH